jgi:hypothetical protein
MGGGFMAADGAQFMATIEKKPDGLHAFYKVICNVDDFSLSESDLRVFAIDIDAKNWIRSQAIHRGFTAHSVTRK